jgi:hypothetical protein
MAPATLMLTLFLMSVWTLVLYRLLLRFLGPHVELPLVNMTAVATFAYLDSVLRTHESYTTTLFRAVGLQVLIFVICYLPKIIASPFLGWLSLRLAFYKWRAKRAKPQGKHNNPWGGKR